MDFIDRFERKFLFGLTRLLSLLLIFALLSLILVGGILFGGSVIGSKEAKITASEVIRAVRPGPNSAVEEEKEDTSGQRSPGLEPFSDMKLPPPVQKYLGNPENLRVLKGWIGVLPESRRQEFLDELSAVVLEAERANVEPVEAINKYKEMKLARIESEKEAISDRKEMRLLAAGAIAFAIMLVAMFSLILVLLAIERNTRKVPE